MLLTFCEGFIVSLFTVQSFGRVVRRHEREAILQHPSAWDPVYRAELEAAQAFARDRRRPFSPVSVVSRPGPRRAAMDPFEDFRANSSKDALTTAEMVSSSRYTLTGPVEQVIPPFARSRELSVSTADTYELSGTSAGAVGEHLYFQPR